MCVCVCVYRCVCVCSYAPHYETNNTYLLHSDMYTNPRITRCRFLRFCTVSQTHIHACAHTCARIGPEGIRIRSFHQHYCRIHRTCRDFHDMDCIFGNILRKTRIYNYTQTPNPRGWCSYHHCNMVCSHTDYNVCNHLHRNREDRCIYMLIE